MVLVRLIDQQIADNWTTIKFAIKESLPPTAKDTEEVYNNILQKFKSTKNYMEVTIVNYVRRKS